MATGTKIGGSKRAAHLPPKKSIDESTYSGRVAARLRSLREERGWLVAKLTEEINTNLPASDRVATSTVHGWDNRSRKVDPDYYPAIAKAFRLSVRAFLPKQ